MGVLRDSDSRWYMREEAGGHISAFIVHPLTNFFGLEMTHTLLLISLVMSVLYMTDIELKDLIGGVQAVFKYIYKFIYAFFLARKEANNLQIENILDSEKISNNTEPVKNNRVGKNKLNDKVKNVSNITDLKQKKVKSTSKVNNKSKSSNEYKLPPVSLLKHGSSLSTSKASGLIPITISLFSKVFNCSNLSPL